VDRKHFVIAGLGALLLGAGAFGLRRARTHAGTGPDATASAVTVGAPSAGRPVTPLEPAEIIYDGKFARGWDDWGWGPHEFPKNGPAKIGFGGYGGIVLHHADLPARFSGFSFRYKPPADWPEFLFVSVKRTGSPDSAFRQVVVEPRHVARLPDGWREVLIDWKSLDPSNLPIERITIGARSIVPSEPVLLDKIMLTSASSNVPVPNRDAALTVSCQGGLPINPLIYGATGEPASGKSANRIGGNPTTRLNWDAGNLWNTGSDWFFENGSFDGNVWDWLEGGVSGGLQTALTVPMIGWVAKDATSVGFPTSKISGQRKHDPNRPEAGDGFRPDGTPIPPGPPTETSVGAPPEVIGRWIRTIVEKDRARGKRSVQMYLLDNEPSLWNTTHRDVHPDPVTYEELLDRTVRYGTAIRQADPEAVIAGPTEWGWSGYLYSAVDREAGWKVAPDRRAHGGIPLVAWYLQRLAEYEKNKGVRLLDVLDLHYYPAAVGVFGKDARTDAEGSELRLRSTRSLWDPTYLDESWIKDSIRLIPRMKQWVAENYPGRKVSIGEWNFGADEHISGGLATAEALGRFGQQGLDAAFFYGGLKEGSPVFWAFRAYRNFDGKGGRFQDLALTTREADKVSFFASRNAAGTRLVAIVLNRDSLFAVNARITFNNCGGRASRRVFDYGPQSKALVERNLEPAEADPGVPVRVEPYSFAVLDFSLAAGGASAR